MAPIYDTGNSLFYNKEIIPSKGNLLDIRVTSFCEREAAYENACRSGKGNCRDDQPED